MFGLKLWQKLKAKDRKALTWSRYFSRHAGAYSFLVFADKIRKSNSEENTEPSQFWKVQ